MRRTRTRATLLVLALATTVGFAGCSSDSKSTEAAVSGESAAAAPKGDKPTIKLVENAWTASAVDVEIAKQLIEKNLGNKVEVVKIDENLHSDAADMLRQHGHDALTVFEQGLRGHADRDIADAAASAATVHARPGSRCTSMIARPI